jgi:hypothetical protein
MSGPTDEEKARKPAVLNLDDGTRAELPDYTLGEAMALLDLARENGGLIGGEIDPDRVVSVGFYEDEEE